MIADGEPGRRLKRLKQPGYGTALQLWSRQPGRTSRGEHRKRDV
nr:hypothetical protein [Kibdelosporangium sp. MJ126-NF4]